MNEDDGVVLLVKENQERRLREQRKKLEMWSRGGKKQLMDRAAGVAQ